jgi:peptide deformylase
VLSRKTKRVTKIDASIKRLIEDMWDTMYAEHGVGLAANQIGVPLRIAVIAIPATEEEPEERYVLINPEFVKKGGQRTISEGCLSVAGYKGMITRSEWVKVKALNAEGKEIRIKAEGLLAQALEHEIDHLDGLLYVDRLREQGSLETLQKVEAPEPVEA